MPHFLAPVAPRNCAKGLPSGAPRWLACLLGAAAFLGVVAATPTPAAALGPGYVNAGFYGGYYGGRRFYGGRGFYRRGFYGRRFYRGGFYGPRFRRGFYGGRYFYGPRFRRGFYGPGFYGYRRGIGPAEAFGITAGIIGGAILIDRALDDRYRAPGREVVYLPKYPPDYDATRDGPRDLDPDFRGREDDFESGVRFRGRSTEGDRDAAADLEEERRRLEEERQAFAEERARFEEERRRYLAERNLNDPGDDPQIEPDDGADLDPDFDEEDLRRSPVRPVPRSRPPSRPPSIEARRPNEILPEPDDGLEEDLLGAPDAAARRIAFSECVAEVRRAASAEGLIVAVPDAPTEAPASLDERTYRLSAAFTAEASDGDSYRRLMLCDVDGRGVKRLEIV